MAASTTTLADRSALEAVNGFYVPRARVRVGDDEVEGIRSLVYDDSINDEKNLIAICNENGLPGEALVNAARRASTYDPEAAARSLLAHDSPRALVDSSSEDVASPASEASASM